jgi:prefoldin subunit 5
MRAQIDSRLDTLKAEFQKGQLKAQQLQANLMSVQETMLRISGAIVVLEEMLSESSTVVPVDQPSREVTSQSSAFAA